MKLEQVTLTAKSPTEGIDNFQIVSATEEGEIWMSKGMRSKHELTVESPSRDSGLALHLSSE